MFNYFLYLVVSQKRLVITENKIDNKDYHLLMSNSGRDKELLLSYIKIYSLGFLDGGVYGEKVINSKYEFE